MGKVFRLLVLLLQITTAQAAVVGIMMPYVEQERIESGKRNEALFAKNRDYLCPGNSAKGLSLCVREYILKMKVETSVSYGALVAFAASAGAMDKVQNSYDPISAQLLTMETLVLMQNNLARENMLCSTIQPSGANHLYEVRKICVEEERSFRAIQARILSQQRKKLDEILALLGKSIDESELTKWRQKKAEELDKVLGSSFKPHFFADAELMVSDKDILGLHTTAVKVSCDKMPAFYKKQFRAKQPCYQFLEGMMNRCVHAVPDRAPASYSSASGFSTAVNRPLPCFYKGVEHLLTQMGTEEGLNLSPDQIVEPFLGEVTSPVKTVEKPKESAKPAAPKENKLLPF